MEYLVQPKSVAFDGAALTAAFTGNEFVLPVKGMSKLSIDIDYTRGGGEASSKMFMKIEHSTDGTNWHSLVIDETSTTSVITAREWEIGNTAKLNVLVDIAYHQIKISVRESGVVTNAGTLNMTVVPSGY